MQQNAKQARSILSTCLAVDCLRYLRTASYRTHSLCNIEFTPIDPDIILATPTTHGLSTPTVAEALYQQGIEQSELGEYDQAIVTFTKVIELAPEWVKDAFVARGWTYHMKGNHMQAALDYSLAIHNDPNYPLGYQGRGIAYYWLGYFDEAIADFDKMFTLGAKDPWARYYRGAAYMWKGEYLRAIEDLTEAIDLYPDYTDAYMVRGHAYLLTENYERALQDEDRAIELNPENAQAYVHRGNALLAQGDLDRAMECFEEALRIDTEYTVAFAYRGWLCGRMGDFPRALEDVDLAFKYAQPPTLAYAHLARGHVYALQSEAELAAAEFDKVLELTSEPWLRVEAEEQLSKLRK